NKLYFQLNKNLLNLYGWKSVHIDASWILEKMKERLDHALESNFHVLPISKFFDGKVEPTTILSEIELNEETENELDESQFEAFQFSISHDISLIWGPPGTGKSHTLAHIIDYFFKKSERTIVTCIANVAVDSLTLKLIDLLDRQGLEVKPGEVLRIGHTRDRKLLATDYLFPHNQKTKQIREIILKKIG